MDRKRKPRKRTGADRNKRIENRGKGFIPKNWILPLLIIGIIILIVLLLNLFTTSVNNFSNSNGNSQENVEVSTTDTMRTDEKFESINEILSNKNNDLKKRIDEYLVSNGLSEENVNMMFYSVENKNYFTFGTQEKIPMKSYNYFIISMLATDLEKEQILDLNTIINIDEFIAKEETEDEDSETEEIDQEEKESNNITLRQVLRNMILEKSEESISAATRAIENASGKNWIALANEKYRLSIDEENQMTKDDIAKILRRLLSKVDNTYAYQDVISTLIENAESRDEFFSLNNTHFIGVEGRSIYQYSIENGFSIGKNNIIYSIQTNYSDKNVMNNLRNIIFEWFEDYK